MGLLGGLITVGVVLFGGDIQRSGAVAEGWQVVHNVMEALWGGLQGVFQPRWVLLLLLSPLLVAVAQELFLRGWAWRQHRQWEHLPWQALGSYSAKRLKRWHERLFKQRSTLRNRLRDLKKEQALYQNIKRERERLLEEQYRPQLKEARLALSDHLSALQEAFVAYDQRAKALCTAEREALLATITSDDLSFPTLEEHSPHIQALKADYVSRHNTLLTEAQATYTAHQQALEAAFQQWSERIQLPQKLLDTDYCRILRKIDELDYSVHQQQRTLIEVNGRLQALRKVLR